MSSLSLYFHTLRYLRPTQLAARLWLSVHRPTIDARSAPPLRPLRASYAEPVAAAATLVAPRTFRFLNVERQCASATDWQPAGADKLWVYNLHYFDDLNAAASATRASWHEELLTRWVAENPPGQGDAWEPYPTSRRIVNWVKWALRGNLLATPIVQSLAVQARWLAKRLEYHLLGNHLLTNAKALLHAGLYFAGPEAESWRETALRIIAREMPEQVLEDGGHFELSTQYHAAALEDLLDMINLQQAYGLQPAAAWTAAALRMQCWLEVMSHPDGGIAFFNDSAFGIAPSAADLAAYLGRLGQPAPFHPQDQVVRLRSSGYVRMQCGPALLLCDCAAVGPDYLPAHAHADSLSFELSLCGERLFVNSGTSQYGVGPERQRQRSTAAHNTVVVDGENSSEVWGGFRVARRARTVVHEVVPGPTPLVEASHDGYRRLAGRNEHRRRWSLEEQSLRIVDHISGELRVAEAWFHLHPLVEAKLHDACGVELLREARCVARMTFEGAAGVEIRSGHWHPNFGVALANQCIVARFAAHSLTTTICWSGAG